MHELKLNPRHPSSRLPRNHIAGSSDLSPPLRLSRSGWLASEARSADGLRVASKPLRPCHSCQLTRTASDYRYCSAAAAGGAAAESGRTGCTWSKAVGFPLHDGAPFNPRRRRGRCDRWRLRQRRCRPRDPAAVLWGRPQRLPLLLAHRQGRLVPGLYQRPGVVRLPGRDARQVPDGAHQLRSPL